jgi:CRISPR type III-A-associated RAMP protein Csm5
MSQELWYSTEAQVKVLAPLHIGSGQRLTPYDFVYQAKARTLHILDEQKLISWVVADEKRNEAFLQAAESGGDAEAFLAQMGVEPGDFASYSLPAHLTGKPAEVLQFMRGASHFPFLPGSSLKGSLRSSLLRGAVLAQPDLQEFLAETILREVNEVVNNDRLRKKALNAHVSHRVEAEVFVPQAGERKGRYANHDLNRALLAGDSAPLAANDGHFEVAEARILSVQSGGDLAYKARSQNPVLIHAEMALPGTTFKMRLSRDLRLLLGRAQANALGLNAKEYHSLMTRLAAYCRLASSDLLVQEICFYRRHHLEDLAKWFEEKYEVQKGFTGEQFFLPLGWGCGYDSKTITDLLGEETFEAVCELGDGYDKGLGRAGNSAHSPWLGPDDAPKSRKVAVRPDGSRQPVGWVEITLKPLGETPAEWEELCKTAVTPSLAFVEIPTECSKGPDKQEKKAPPILSVFVELPKPGDRFVGTVLGTDNEGIVYLEIPGLDADDFALAALQPNDNPQLDQYTEEQLVPCEVIAIEKEATSAPEWRVRCCLA